MDVAAEQVAVVVVLRDKFIAVVEVLDDAAVVRGLRETAFRVVLKIDIDTGLVGAREPVVVIVFESPATTRNASFPPIRCCCALSRHRHYQDR